MSTWHNIPDTHYTVFDRNQARIFLRKNFGKSYEKAFLLANSPTEESDFFRLCYLAKFGGVYVDADDGYHHGFDELFPSGIELVCFREEYGALANNVIIAVPGHPAIEYAMKMAAQSLLAKDNENTWHKTGPGLLSRAVAFFLSNATSEEVAKVNILPLFYLRRRVYIHMDVPHKKTSSYWNARHKDNWSYECLGDI
ncbi:glycosyltransferase [Cobetia marina]